MWVSTRREVVSSGNLLQQSEVSIERASALDFGRLVQEVVVEEAEPVPQERQVPEKNVPSGQ